ncbi:conserved hypothetical protein [Denitrovibrio acetiphilus DSM 12809]|uniref:Uncharacterized protein n=1 Tax=Denitrovibrio acetiphilus (strain DSM 12809 / NBRC 114555 / N2460) TaxID=522772 RepID=D4H889_DENA2|nr:conserved hypothetical protein [Denitrovibrio acetiphilus DSM 12809]
MELVNNFYIQYRDRILLGQALSACFGLLYAVWSVQLTIQMWKREKAPILAMINLMGGTLTGWVLIFCPVLWVWCAEFAGQADPELVKTVHFIGWYVYDMTYMITTVQGFAIGALVFLDKEKPALMPKWAAAFAVFVGASFFPLTFLPYFKDGIFAINGYWSFHTAFIGYGLFIVVICI